jgi:hypothetical protein
MLFKEHFATYVLIKFMILKLLKIDFHKKYKMKIKIINDKNENKYIKNFI